MKLTNEWVLKTIGEALESSTWKQAMNQEMQALQKKLDKGDDPSTYKKKGNKY